ncbi:MAG: protein TolQ [Geminicoccales bacterium]|jgi:biopolymer transport protein TolQ
MADNSIATLGLAGDEVVGLSIWSLVGQADPIVKGVMLILLLCSVWSWTIIFQKLWKFRNLRRRANIFERDFWSGAALDDLYRRLGTRPDNPMASAFAAGMEEWRDAPAPNRASSAAALLTRVGKVMSLTADREIELVERYLSSLATIGATAPFIGLFGTVWGIMGSFQAIALTKNTTLAVVAPGIAEALLATGFGLIAAIPAVVAYNKLSGDVDRYATRVGTFTDEFTVVLSRELDDGQSGFDGSRAA